MGNNESTLPGLKSPAPDSKIICESGTLMRLPSAIVSWPSIARVKIVAVA